MGIEEFVIEAEAFLQAIHIRTVDGDADHPRRGHIEFDAVLIVRVY